MKNLTAFGITEVSAKTEKKVDKKISEKNLLKLKRLCEKVNNRYSKNLNDDDQVAEMFAFEKSVSDCRVIIGWDEYRAISIEQLKKEFKTSKKITENEFYIEGFKCILPIERY